MKKRILLADDQELKGVLARSIFGRESFELLVAASGEEALTLIEEQDPVLAILDLDMLGLSGDACCLRVKQDALLRRTPLALIVSSEAPETRTRCRNCGCDAVLARPFVPQQVIQTACRLLGIQLRGEPRVAVDFGLRLRKGNGKPKPGRATDLNPGGLFVACADLHPAGTELQLELDLPGQPQPLTCRARVVWVNHPEWLKSSRMPHGMGLQLLQPSAAAAAAIAATLGAAAPTH